MSGKRRRAAEAAVDAGRLYPLEEAVRLVRETATAKFAEGVDLCVNLGIDPRQSDQNLRGATVLPHGLGKTARVAVFAGGDPAREAAEAGADEVGLEDLAERMRGGELDFDTVIAAPDAMPVVGALGPVLGPRGLMPNPKTGTVTPDVAAAVRSAKAGQVRYRTEKGGIVHCSIGRAGFEPEQLVENLRSLTQELVRAKPPAAKGVYLRRISISATMGPGVRVDPATV